MMQSIDVWIQKIDKKWLIAFLVGSVIFGTLVITRVFGLIELIPEATVDSEMMYSKDMIYQYLEMQGADGRIGYLHLHLIDYLFITQFYMLLVILLALLMKKLSFGMKSLRLVLLPLAAGVFDLLENIVMDIMISNFPKKLLILHSIAPYFTLMKFIIIYVSFISICILFLWCVFRAFYRKVMKTQGD